MTRRMFSKALGLWFLFIPLGVWPALAQDWAGLKRYAKENQALPAPAKGEHRVVFLGNSITEGWVRIRPAFFQENGYIGRGISGQTSYQFLVRFREDVINLQPKVVVINAGTNDCAENTGPFDARVTLGNIFSMVELARAHKIKVVLTSVLPAAGFGWNKRITDAPERVNALNAGLREYAQQHKIPYVDYFEALVGEDGRSIPPQYAKDGVHPTAEGYALMEALIKPVVEKLR